MQLKPEGVTDVVSVPVAEEMQFPLPIGAAIAGLTVWEKKTKASMSKTRNAFGIDVEVLNLEGMRPDDSYFAGLSWQ
jgi:pyruvate/2-oxoglutarate/acetoin dehydrogenase E1 component